MLTTSHIRLELGKTSKTGGLPAPSGQSTFGSPDFLLFSKCSLIDKKIILKTRVSERATLALQNCLKSLFGAIGMQCPSPSKIKTADYTVKFLKYRKKHSSDVSKNLGLSNFWWFTSWGKCGYLFSNYIPLFRMVEMYWFKSLSFPSEFKSAWHPCWRIWMMHRIIRYISQPDL